MVDFLKSKTVSRITIAIIFMIAGILHFVKTQAYITVMPEYIPKHRAMVLISGVAECMGGVGVLISNVRKWAGGGLIILLITVFPVNIEMAVDAYTQQGWGLTSIAYLLRLPLQFVLIYWIYWSCIKCRQSSN